MAEERTVPKPTMNLANDVDVVVPRDEIIHPLHALLRVDAYLENSAPGRPLEAADSADEVEGCGL